MTLETLITRLLVSRAQFHIWHLQTRSFAEHKGLECLYDAVSSHADTLAEATQDKTRWDLAGTATFKNYEDVEQITKSVDSLLRDVNAIYSDPDCVPYICNLLQSLEADLHKGVYLLSLS